jgi:hypothetical protein
MRIIAALMLVAVTAMADDSAVVAAAKRSKDARSKSATPVITNASLVKKGGHVTTTKSQTHLAPVAPTKKTPAVAAPPASAAPKKIATPDPVEDALQYDEGDDREQIVDPLITAVIPKGLAAKAELKKPSVVPPVAPPVVKPATPDVVPQTTPQYTPAQPPPPSHTPRS